MAHRTIISAPFMEAQSAFIKGTFQDEDGAAIPLASLNTVILTLYNEADGVILNGRNGGSIKNINGGVIDANGKLTLELGTADMVLAVAASLRETHVALIKWTYGAGKAGAHEVVFFLENTVKV